MRGNERAFQHLQRFLFHDGAILEGARLAFIGIDDDMFRPRLLQHRPPLQMRGKARAAQPAQPGDLQRLQDGIGVRRSRAHLLQHGQAALLAVGLQLRFGVWWSIGPRRITLRLLQQHFRVRMAHAPFADHGEGRGIAAALAWRGDDAHPGGIRPLPQAGQQFLRPCQHAG